MNKHLRDFKDDLQEVSDFFADETKFIFKLLLILLIADVILAIVLLTNSP